MSDYGEKDNYDVAERFGVKKADFPAYKMFVRGKTDPISYTGDTKDADRIKRFVVESTGWLDATPTICFLSFAQYFLLALYSA